MFSTVFKPVLPNIYLNFCQIQDKLWVCFTIYMLPGNVPLFMLLTVSIKKSRRQKLNESTLDVNIHITGIGNLIF